MSAFVWASARAAVRAHRATLAGSALVAALCAALLTATGAWLEAGLRRPDDVTGSMLVAVTSSFAGTAVVIALLVVASTFTAALRPRAREFALLRAVGATVAQVRRLVTAEVLLVFAVAAPLGALAGLLLAPRVTGVLAGAGIVPAGFTMSLSPWPVLAAFALLLPTALAAARLSGRESARLAPAGALRTSAVEPSGPGRGRIATAAALALGGLVVATTPFVAPGTMGAASASLAAVLLVIAAAVAGPGIVGWTARRGLAARRRPGAVTTLALVNARGFSRRLTGAIVPLALLLALGGVQSGTSATVARAAGEQVRDAIAADLVVRSADGGVTSQQAAAVAALPGVTSVTVTSVARALVRSDQEDADAPVVGGLSWEASTLRTVPAHGGDVDPDVTAGSLAGLARDDGIAISRDAAMGTAGVGDPVDVRVGRTQTRFTIVAVYERGLGVGDYLVGPGGAARAGIGADGSMLLVRAAGDPAGVRAAIDATGLRSEDVAAYAREVRAAAEREQSLSTVLLLALLALVAVMAANTLVTITRSRRDELALLRRTGATRQQLVAMLLAESALTAVTAVVVGLACLAPALVGVAQGLLRVPVPVVEPGVLGALVGVVVLIGVVTPVAAGLRAVRARTA